MNLVCNSFRQAVRTMVKALRSTGIILIAAIVTVGLLYLLYELIEALAGVGKVLVAYGWTKPLFVSKYEELDRFVVFDFAHFGQTCDLATKTLIVIVACLLLIFLIVWLAHMSNSIPKLCLERWIKKQTKSNYRGPTAFVTTMRNSIIDEFKRDYWDLYNLVNKAKPTISAKVAIDLYRLGIDFPRDWVYMHRPCSTNPNDFVLHQKHLGGTGYMDLYIEEGKDTNTGYFGMCVSYDNLLDTDEFFPYPAPNKFELAIRYLIDSERHKQPGMISKLRSILNEEDNESKLIDAIREFRIQDITNVKALVPEV